MYSALTRSIRVDVEPIYLEDESAPEQDYYVWAYRVHIENLSAEIVQLHSRYWQITDAKGRVHEVRGVGVVGEHPWEGRPLQLGDTVSASSLFSIRATPSTIRAARRCRRLPASWSAITIC